MKAVLRLFDDLALLSTKIYDLQPCVQIVELRGRFTSLTRLNSDLALSSFFLSCSQHARAATDDIAGKSCHDAALWLSFSLG